MQPRSQNYGRDFCRALRNVRSPAEALPISASRLVGSATQPHVRETVTHFRTAETKCAQKRRQVNARPRARKPAEARDDVKGNTCGNLEHCSVDTSVSHGYDRHQQDNMLEKGHQSWQLGKVNGSRSDEYITTGTTGGTLSLQTVLGW